MTEENETVVEGAAVDVPEDEAQAAGVALERAQAEGLMPHPVEQARSVTYREAVELGHVLAASGYFKDAETAAQAAVKVMVGAELGFAPMASIMGVHVIEGRPSVGGRLLGAIVKRDPHYDFELDGPHVERGNDGKPIGGECTVTITYDHEPLEPVSKFTWQEAVVAGLVKDRSNWIKWPAKMLYWRALSWGVDYHCPHLVGGLPLLATEDAEDDGAEDRPLVRELNPPAERPPALSDEEAESLRVQARGVYDELKAINPTLIVPGRFGNMIANAEHSHERLRQVVSSLEDLLATEQGIVDATAKLVELGDQAEADAALEEALKLPSRIEARDHLQAVVNAKLDAEAAESENGKDD